MFYGVHSGAFTAVRRKVDKNGKPTRKMIHTNPILEYLEYFCQMSSTSIHIILSYTVSKLTRFLSHSIVPTVLTDVGENRTDTKGTEVYVVIPKTLYFMVDTDVLSLTIESGVLYPPIMSLDCDH